METRSAPGTGTLDAQMDFRQAVQELMDAIQQLGDEVDPGVLTLLKRMVTSLKTSIAVNGRKAAALEKSRAEGEEAQRVSADRSEQTAQRLKAESQRAAGDAADRAKQDAARAAAAEAAAAEAAAEGFEARLSAVRGEFASREAALRTEISDSQAQVAGSASLLRAVSADLAAAESLSEELKSSLESARQELCEAVQDKADLAKDSADSAAAASARSDGLAEEASVLRCRLAEKETLLLSVMEESAGMYCLPSTVCPQLFALN